MARKRRLRRNTKKGMLDKKYQIGLVGLVAIAGVSVYFADDIKAMLSSAKKSAQSGLGAIGMQNPAHMGLLSVDGKVRRVNPGHMGALHMNPGHMGMMHGAHMGAIGIE